MLRWIRVFSDLSLAAKINIVIAGFLVGILVYVYNFYFYGKIDASSGPYIYPENYVPNCQQLTSFAVDHSPREHGKGIVYNVTTPLNYKSDYAHSLLLVWAPNGFNALMSERFTGMTREATQNGFIVAHVGSIRLNLENIENLSQIPLAITKQWCVDPKLVFYSGHSDGGTLSNALAIMSGLPVYPRAIAPSAMGMRGADMVEFACPRPTSVLLMHNQNDTHFPGFGEEVIRWWANCNQCSEETRVSERNSCTEYVGCVGEVKTLFCEPPGNHLVWPGRAISPVAFFSSIIETVQ